MLRALVLRLVATTVACTASVEDPRHVETSIAEPARSASASASASGSASASKPAPRGTDPPARIVEILSFTPYVEDRCAQDAAHAGAKRCRYRMREIDAEVVTLSPSAERVARWIVEASAYAEPIDALYAVDRARWEDALALVARHVKHQSSRIFPIAGDVVEDLGSGPRAFAFDRGVVTPCDGGGCACRINSVKPGVVCRYRDAFGVESEASCRARIGGPKGIEAWRAACEANHRAAMEADSNDHFRAAAFDLGRRVRTRCEDGCDPAAVVAAVEKSLRLAKP